MKTPKLTLTVWEDPIVGHYGRAATSAGQIVVSTGYFKTEDEARAALYAKVAEWKAARSAEQGA